MVQVVAGSNPVTHPKRWLGAALATLLLLAGCADPGERAAQDELDDRVQATVNRLDQDWRNAGDESVALLRSVVITPGRTETGHTGGEFEVTVEPLAWDSAHFDLRFIVRAQDYHDGAVFGTSYGPGSAQECVRLTLGFDIGRTSIDCTGHTAVPVPAAIPLAELDPAALLTALRAGSFPAAVAAARQAYEPLGLVVDAEVVDGTWAVVVVRARQYDCIAAIRTPDRTVRYVHLPRATRQPGEGGCSPSNAVNPVRTH